MGEGAGNGCKFLRLYTLTLLLVRVSQKNEFFDEKWAEKVLKSHKIGAFEQYPQADYGLDNPFS